MGTGGSCPVKDTLLSDKQKQILRYRNAGMTFQQIADIYGTTKADICQSEKRAKRKIQCARATMESLRTLGIAPVCIFRTGSDLLDGVSQLRTEMTTMAVPVPEDPLDLINQIRSENLAQIHGRYIVEDIAVYLFNDGTICSGPLGEGLPGKLLERKKKE